MPPAVSDVLADPVGVAVDLVTLEPALDRATVADVVRTVAAGRVKRRRLAQALLDNTSLLVNGRSPAPRAAADLLIALRAAAAVTISPPCCARCGKHLRTLHRRGEEWYCGGCGPTSEPCAACRRTRRVASTCNRSASRATATGGADPVVLAGYGEREQTRTAICGWSPTICLGSRRRPAVWR